MARSVVSISALAMSNHIRCRSGDQAHGKGRQSFLLSWHASPRPFSLSANDVIALIPRLHGRTRQHDTQSSERTTVQDHVSAVEASKIARDGKGYSRLRNSLSHVRLC